MFNQYDSANPTDIINLINDSKKQLVAIIDRNNRSLDSKSEFIASIIMHVSKHRKMSFKQWKALKAFLRDCAKSDITYKTF